MIESSMSGFHAADWVILGCYFVLLAVTGVLFTRRQNSTDDYFRAAGRIPMWAAAISFLATALSAATFIGGPQQAYRGDLTYLSANLGSILAVLIVALFFVPAFYKNKVATVYGLLGVRFGSRAAMTGSGAFMIGRVFASGARLYIAALPASLVVFGDIDPGHQIVTISVIAVIGIVYTLAGGIRTVILTDVIQTVVFVGAACAALILLVNRIPLSLPEILEALRHPGEGLASKLTTVKLGTDGFGSGHNYTILTAIFGFTLLNLGAYGTDQDMAQRMLTCRSAVKGGWSAITAIFIGLPVTALFMSIGLLLFIFYARPDLMGAAAPAYEVVGSRKIFLTYILNEMPAGLSGLMMAGLFAASLSSLNSALNAMSSSFIHDVYKKFFPRRDDRHYLKMGRTGVVFFGVVLCLFAIFSVFWQESQPETTLIDFALMVMVFAYSGLVAVFLTALFTKRGNQLSVFAAIVVGFLSVLILQSNFSGEVAFPWQMLIATSLAFGVCCVGKQTGS